MIEKIKSIKRELDVNLYNRLSGHIYSLDSINLIIGNNGSGKTRLIKDIIRDLTSEESPEEFIAEGLVDKIGLVYYTAAPFYKRMKGSNNKRSAFIDASPGRQANQNFISAAQEYVAVSTSLEISDDLHSVQTFDFEETALNLTSALSHPGLNGEGFVSFKLRDNYEKYRNLRIRYSRLTEQLAEIGATDVDIGHFRDEERLSRVHRRRETLAKELESIARLILDQRDAVVTQFMREAGWHRKTQMVDWVVTTCLMNTEMPTRWKAELAYRLQHGKFRGPIEITGLSKRWATVHELITKFVETLERLGAGTLRASATGAEITVDIPRLIAGKTERGLIKAAHKYGLVRIGFDQISSGQAAILHQMISISHAIQELAAQKIKHILLFVDEGDLLLHLSWQREYINLIDSRLSRVRENLDLKSIQVIIASHSPILATDILRDSINRLGDGGRLPSFGAPLQQVVNYSFDTPSIGVIAQRTIQNLKEKSEYTDADLSVISQIDDEFIRKVLIEKVSK